MRTVKQKSLFGLFLLILFLLVNISVSAQLQISISPESGYNALDFSVSKTDFLVATVIEICTESGYTVILETANGSTTGLFIGNNPANSDTLAYEIKYDNDVTILTGGTAIVSDSASPTVSAGVEKQLKISYTGSGSLTADTYSDTFTLTIAAK